jgi:hypothetical protein
MMPEDRINSIENKLQEVLLTIKSIAPIQDGPRMLTTNEVMDRLKIGRWKFDQLIADNILEYVRKGRKIYVFEASIQKYFTGE